MESGNLFIFFKDVFILCVWMFSLHVCLYTMGVSGPLEGQRECHFSRN